MNKQQLASRIWASANQMRSKIEANEYKDYILGFIFYKFLSDHEEQFVRSKGLDEQGMKDELHETNAEAVSLVRPKLGYFISYENLFSTWIKPKRDGEDEFDVSNVRDAIGAFNRLIAPTHKKVFANIFKTLETGLSKLGDSAANQTKAIKKLLNLIRDIPMDGRQDYDVLGFIYEYLISMFAANAGKKAGEFYTPHEVALFMADIVADHLKERKTIEIYDPTSGSGSLLINIGRAVARHLNDPDKIKYYAQELKENTYNLTRMNLVMRGIIPGNIVVRNGDTLERDWPYFDEEKPDTTYDPLFVDAVVSNPPYSQHWVPANRESDPRYAGFGIAPKSKADYAFLLHDLYHLRDDGIMTIVLPHGVLFRGKPDDGSEGSIRRALVEGNHIDAIIGLPPNIFFGTGIPTIVMVLRKHRDRDDTLIVDASRGFVKDGKKNRLRAMDVKRIVDTVVNRSEMPAYSLRVRRDEIRANDYNLNIPRYVRADETEHWDIRAVMFGGIPNQELDELSGYWKQFPRLRSKMFTVEGNYSRLVDENVVDVIEHTKSVQDYSASFVKALDGFDLFLKRELIDRRDKVAINQEEQKIANEIFARIGDAPLIDKYEAYQHLDDEWIGTSADLEIIQTEGFDAVRKVDPNMVLKKKKDSEDEMEEVQDGWRGRVIPFDLVARTKFATEVEKIVQLEKDAERAASELAALAEEIPEEEREGLVEEEGGEISSKKICEKAAEVFADIETPEIEALSAYLALSKAAEKKEFQSAHPEVNWTSMDAAKNGTYNKGPVQKRVFALRSNYQFPEDSFEALICEAYRLVNENKAATSEARRLRKELDQKCIEAIEHLTDKDALMLLELKWVRPLVEKLLAMPAGLTDALAGKIKVLEKKYSTTMSEVAARVDSAQRELASLTGELTGGADDLAGIAAWRKELAK